jgi:hypothetical protein
MKVLKIGLLSVSIFIYRNAILKCKISKNFPRFSGYNDEPFIVPCHILVACSIVSYLFSKYEVSVSYKSQFFGSHCP